MEDDIIAYVNSQNSERKAKLIEYFKVWDSKDIEEFAERRKKLGGRSFQDQKMCFQNFLMSVLPIDSILKKLQSDSQSHST